MTIAFLPDSSLLLTLDISTKAKRSTPLILVPDVWYQVQGAGSRLIASTCNNETSFDIQLSIYYSDREWCSSLTCVTGSVNYKGCGLSSSITWLAENEVQYFIKVSGGSSGAGRSAGEYALSVSTFQVLNDVCQTAIHLEPNASVYGSTLSASFEYGYGPCGSASEVVGNGVWYSTVGNGVPYTASTSRKTNFDTQITIFSGNCRHLACVAGNDQGCGDQSLVTWNTVNGTVYYILVHGFLGARGDFFLKLKS